MASSSWFVICLFGVWNALPSGTTTFSMVQNLNLFVSFGYDGLFTWMASILYLLIVQTRWDYLHLYTYFLHLVWLQSSRVLSILHLGGFPTVQSVPGPSLQNEPLTPREKWKKPQIQGPKVSRFRVCFLSHFSRGHFFLPQQKPSNFFSFSLGDPDSYLATQDQISPIFWDVESNLWADFLLGENIFVFLILGPNISTTAHFCSTFRCFPTFP